MMGLPECREVAFRLSRAKEQPLTARERVENGVHLLFCDQCRRYAKQLGQLWEAASHAAEEIENQSLDADAKKRISDALAQERRQE